MSKNVSLESKKAYTRDSRSSNYIASLRLEGITIQKNTDTSKTKALLIAKYKKTGLSA